MAKSRPGKKTKANFVFKGGTGASIGQIAAEDDARFLNTCFIDAGHLSRALDLEDPGSILVGRTGSGKSAALIHIEQTQDNVINIDLGDLSLRYISNSNILKFFESIPIDLDVFYQLLWRHAFTIELLNYRYRVRKPTDFHSLVDKVRESLLHSKNKTKCIKYLTDFQGDFFKTTQERVIEAVERFETELKGGLNLGTLGIPITAEGATQLTQEQKIEIADKARRVVSEVQIDKLSIVNQFMADYSFSDFQKKHFIIVDRLDEDWAEDAVRFKLIRALVETIRSFRKMRSVKILIALRLDLLDTIYDETRSRGFQREKYKQYEIDLKWTPETLHRVVDKRIETLIRHQYTSAKVNFSDLFPQKYKGHTKMFDHLINRSLHRPRDLIQFINEILANSVGKSTITAATIDTSEGEYSKQRLDALRDEWEGEHPVINNCFEIFRGGLSQFKLSDLEALKIDDLCLASSEHSDSLGKIASQILSAKFDSRAFNRELLAVLYKIGFVSVRPSVASSVQSSYLGGFTLKAEDVTEDMRFMITPMLWRALNIQKGAIKGQVEAVRD